MENKTVRVWYDQESMNVDEWGWYAVAEVNGEPITDSVKADFPVCVDNYDLDGRDDLLSALDDAFPDFNVIQEATHSY